MVEPAGFFVRVYRAVRRIPRGRVATYGQVAALAGLHGHARQVGYALHALRPGVAIPWHRVLNAQGKISLGAREGGGVIQRLLLEREGLAFDDAGRLDLRRFQWKPSTARKAKPPGRGKARHAHSRGDR